MTRNDVRRMVVYMGLAAAAMMSNWQVQAETINWKNNLANYSSWHDKDNWIQGKVPGDGDDVVIAYGLPLLTNATARLKSLLIDSRTLAVSNNWDATIYAETLILSNLTAQIAAIGAFPNAGPSNRLHIVCSNLTVTKNHATWHPAFVADYAGYRHGSGVNMNGHGPGFGVASYFGAGGSYGGGGGACPNRYGTINTGFDNLISYGAADAPTAPGSGGGSGAAYPAYKGGDGGGAIRIEASGDVVLNGLACRANGQAAGGYGGGGSGGSIYISCRTISGDAIIRANGGDRSSADRAASGGGGRIAVHYDPKYQTTIPNIRFEANPGRSGGFPMGDADSGTIWFPNALFVTETIDRLSGQLVIPSFTSWSPNNLLITNCWVRFPVDGFKLSVAGNMTIGTGGRYDVGGDTYTVEGARVHRPLSTTAPVLAVGGDLTLVDGGILGVYSAETGAFIDKMGATTGAWVKVAGDMHVGANSWVYPFSHSTDGGSPLFTLRNLTVAENAGFNADYKGAGVRHTDYGYGYGYGSFTNGASFGGKGGPTNSVYVRPAYGSMQEPNHPGSSGSSTGFHMCMPGAGGGLIQIEALGTVQIDGRLSANGFHGKSYNGLNTSHGHATGGSGGGIRVSCRRFNGKGLLSAEGGDSWLDGGCGGGGRIAVWRVYDAFSGTTSVAGGDMTTVVGGYDVSVAATFPGALGTVFWGDNPQDSTIVVLR